MRTKAMFQRIALIKKIQRIPWQTPSPDRPGIPIRHGSIMPG
ncbi:hypothetical protein ACETRX_07135 [Labrys portucalensis]|uniref:Uncharacterized protein n=1 Tax=Labrys neptuniae TaxID=376174 RepID=A0ABV6ZB45_9HYPH